MARTRAHGAHHEEEFHAREQDLLAHLEDSRIREKKLEDQKHNLEVCLVDATQQIQELKVSLFDQLVAILSSSEKPVSTYSSCQITAATP